MIFNSKRSSLCFGLSLVLSIIFGLFFFVPSDVSATQYQIRSVMFSSFNDVDPDSSGLGNGNLGPSLVLEGVPSSRSYEPFKFDGFFSDGYTPIHGECSARYPFPNSQFSYPTISTSGDFQSIRYPIGLFYSPVQYNNPPLLCRYTRPWGSDFQAPFNDSSIHGILPKQFFQSISPYWYTSSASFVYDLNTSDGLHRETRLNISDIFGGPVDTFHRLTLPFGIDESLVTGDLTAGRILELKGSFMFEVADDLDPSTTPFVFSDANPNSIYFNFRVHRSVHSYDSVSCSYNLIDNRSNENEFPWELTFSCPLEVSTFVRDGSYALSLDIGVTPDIGGSYSGTIFNYPSKWTVLTSLYLVTDLDDTPSSDYWGVEPTGADPGSVPGSASDSNSEVDWLSSLVNMFNFKIDASTFNPFYPIFRLFSDNNRCANIPIIAGMLGSENTTYCPWFSPTTRNILTPVLSIASVMLLFGFFVRWLGASSGNMFEDQTSHKWGDVQFKQKGK